MKHILLSVVIALLPISAQAQATKEIIANVVENHIINGFRGLDLRADTFLKTALTDCDPTSKVLRTTFADTFDAWILVSHLRFGPTEVDDRAFALAFWPDSRGATPRSLAGLIAEHDPVGTSPEDYTQVSIAARGFYAMEFLLYDQALYDTGDPNYICTLIQTVAADIASTSSAILEGWQSDYKARLLSPNLAGTYRSDEEVLQELFKALTTGLQFTSETRLGRPLGTFERPRPMRAESWRSGRSARHVDISISTLGELAMTLAGNNTDLSKRIFASFKRAALLVVTLDDPTFAGVSNPQSRLKIEALQQSINAIRTLVRTELGPTLGVAAGFNALDGD